MYVIELFESEFTGGIVSLSWWKIVSEFNFWITLGVNSDGYRKEIIQKLMSFPIFLSPEPPVTTPQASHRYPPVLSEL